MTTLDGRSQRDLYSKEETVLHTVSTDVLMMSLLIDVWKKRYVATVDVNEVYLHAEMDDFNALKLEGEAIDIICKVNGIYVKTIVWKEVIY